MADYREQLISINALRERQRACDEALYRSRLELHRTGQQLRRARQQYTVVNPERDRDIAVLRARIARLDARLAALRAEWQAVGEWLSQLAEQERLVEHLQKNIAAAESRAGQLRQQIAEFEAQQPPAPEEEMRRLRAELERLERLLEELKQSLSRAADVLGEMRQQEGAQRQKQEALQREMDAVREEMRGLQGQLTELLRPDFADEESLGARKNELEASSKRLHADLSDCNSKLADAIAGLYRENPHPKTVLPQFDDRTPFLLFPLRLETIFVPLHTPEGRQRTELWVRVYPDDIAVHTHEKVLTDREVVAGELYWTELVAAEHLRSERDKRRRAAWRHIVELFGGQRAAWAAAQTKPSDWNAWVANGAVQTLPDLLRTADADFFNNLLALPLTAGTRAALEKAITDNDGDALSLLAESEQWFDRINAAVRTRIAGFPPQDLTKTDAWSRAPRTRVLPDRFVLLLYNSENDSEPREIVGNIIPDTLFLGPDPLDAEAAFAQKDSVLTFAGEFDWMADFDKAVAQGMGFRVALSEEEARGGFAKIFALGVLLSADAADSGAMLDELIENHHFSPKGFSIVPQGAPTNNTERDGSGFSDNDPFDDLAFFTDTTPPAFDPADPDPKKSRTDARLLADALGIQYTTLQTVLHADQTDVIEAQAMNTALFPCTLGYWLHTWMSPVLSEQAARQTRSFFTRYVSGRGTLPAVRVGNQPYGVLLTSDFSRWKYPSRTSDLVNLAFFDDETIFLEKLYGVLKELEEMWQNIAQNKVQFVGKPGTDTSGVLLNILGLHPASVEFFQRIGYSEEYLSNLDNFQSGGRYYNEWASLVLSMPATLRLFLQQFGYSGDIATVRATRSMKVLWQHFTTPLNALNLVDAKPPSETNGLTINYIDWLNKADSTQRIINQDFSFLFVDVSAPTALLYLMLRNAMLLQLHRGAYDWLRERTIFDEKLENAHKFTTLPGVQVAAPTVSRYEIMATRVEAAEPANPAKGMSVADFIWLGPNPAEMEAAFLREQKAVLPLLAPMPTARLERCFIEHLDCCNYRLDAWQTGLFAQRLQAQRAVSGQGEGRQTGIYLGAFGWVEDLRPAGKIFLSPENLPPSLRPDDTQPILEEDDMIPPGAARQGNSRQGGFVHAPSLNHASAAALLRNAYLSYADPQKAEVFSVNLSSERVRRAQFILEGLRNGQPIEALLGYQFERGLHDRSSESAERGDIPVLNLNQFILNYREAFPFESREVAQTGSSGAAETVPAYSVVNGLKLMDASLTPANNYGITGSVLPTLKEGEAILAEQNRLRDTLDAVKDLLMAENAYQLVQGNFDRVAAVSLAQKEGHIPPDLEVVNTPRGSEFTFTNRVTLHFDDLDPAQATSNPWPGMPMTPRARAETGMNYWLGSILGNDPTKIVCHVFWLEQQADGTEITHDRQPIALAELELQPIDFVWMTNNAPDNTGGATELETRISCAYRRINGIGDDKTLRIEFNPPVSPTERSFAQLFPQVQQLRALLSGSRALHAEDFLPAPGGKTSAVPVDKNNPKGYDLPELEARVLSAFSSLTVLADTLDGPSAPQVEIIFVKDPDVPADDETFTLSLGAAFDKLEENKVIFTDADKLIVHFAIADAETLRQNLQTIAAYGIADAFPTLTDLNADAARADLLARAHRLARRLRRAEPKDGVLDKASAVLAKVAAETTIEKKVAKLLEAGKLLFGEAFEYLPKFFCYNEIDLVAADAARAQLLNHAVTTTPGITGEEVVEEWLQGLARVRPKLHRWEMIRTLADALNDASLPLHPVQVPFRANDSWLAVSFPEKDPTDPTLPFGISRDTLSVVAHGASAFRAGQRQCGLLLDDWTEEIPTGRETTGISFRFNQPNAAPPQAMLLVVTPEQTGSWDWYDLVGTLEDTLRRAKRRAVEPEQLEQNGGLSWNALAPALVSEFSTQYDSDVSLDLMFMVQYEALSAFYAQLIQTS